MLLFVRIWPIYDVISEQQYCWNSSKRWNVTIARSVISVDVTDTKIKMVYRNSLKLANREELVCEKK